MLKQPEVEKEEERLRQEINQLSESRRKDFYSLVKRRVKDPDTYATLNWFFVTGLHHFYLGKVLSGLFDLAIFITAICLMVFLNWYFTGIVIILAISAWELWALFRSQIIVQDWNNRIYQQVLKQVVSSE